MALGIIRSLRQVHSYKTDDKGWNATLLFELAYVFYGTGP